MNDIHLSNIETKIKRNTEPKKVDELKEIRDEYINIVKNIKKELNNKNFNEVAKSINEYKAYLNEKNKKLEFTSQSKFESTVLESFISIILESVICNNNLNDENIIIGNQKNYSKMLFAPKNYDNFIDEIDYVIDTKDQDASISKNVNLIVDGHTQKIAVPIVAFECKTYLDKTMLEGTLSTSEKIKSGNPYCYFAIVCERYEVSLQQSLSSSSLNQIFVLTKSKKDRNSNVLYHESVIELLYNSIEKHLLNNWGNVEKNLVEKGIILYE